MVAKNAPATTPSTSPHAFNTTLRLEEDVFAGPVGASDPFADLTFWSYLTPSAETDATLLYPVELIDVVSGTPATIELELQGATEHEDQPHRIEVLWNGASIGVQEFFGRRAVTLEFAATAASSVNTLTLRSTQAGEESSTVYLNAIDIDYERVAVAETETVEFIATSQSDVAGLRSSTAELYDITSPSMTLRIGAVDLHLTGSSYGVSFASEDGRRIWMGASASIQKVASLEAFSESTLRRTSNTADYVIITHASLLESANSIATFRAVQGHQTLVVDVADVYRAFGDAYPNPWAIRSFLRFANERWATPPKNVLLLGAGHLDYKGVLQTGDNLLPPALASTDAGLLPSDTLLADLVGDDGVPDIAIGRLPFWNDEQVQRWLSKVKTFEAGIGTLDLVFTSDRDDVASFAAAMDRVGDVFDNKRSLSLETEATEDARARLHQWWGEGVSWLNYIGHGGLDRLGTDGLVAPEDLPMLAGMSSSPVLAAWSCNLARFDIPGYDPLGVQMLQQGVTTAVFSSTGWFNHYDTEAMRDAFYTSLSLRSAETIGELKLRAHRAGADADLQTHATWALLGDPAMKIAPPSATLSVGSTNQEPPKPASACSVGSVPGGFQGGFGVFFVVMAIAVRRSKRA